MRQCRTALCYGSEQPGLRSVERPVEVTEWAPRLVTDAFHQPRPDALLAGLSRVTDKKPAAPSSVAAGVAVDSFCMIWGTSREEALWLQLVPT